MKPAFKNKTRKFLLILPIIFIFGFFYANADNLDTKEVLIKLKNSDEIYKIKFNKNEDINKIKTEYKKNDNVELVSENYNYKIAVVPNDPLFLEQKYLQDTNIDLAWTFTREIQNITIAIVDTGVDLNHPDLKKNIWTNKYEIPNDGIDNDQNGYIDDVYGWDFVNNTSDNNVKISVGYKDYAVNHGTVVAGIASAVTNNKEGISGASWGAKIMSLRALDSQGQGNTYNVARAIDYAIKNSADIINLSFVGGSNDEILSDAIRRAYKAGVVVVAASGNESSIGVDLDLEPKYPVCNDFNDNTVFGVGSVSDTNKISSFSNYGEKCIDIMAPGENFTSTQVYQPAIRGFTEKYSKNWSGTSFAAPLVSATVALIKSVDPSFSIPEIYKILKDSAKSISFENFSKKNKIGAGLLDANNALVMARKLKMNRVVSIITIPNTGINPEIKSFNQNTNKSKSNKIFNDNKSYNYNIISGDLNGDGKQEIIISKTNQKGTNISIYNQKWSLINSFIIDYKNAISMTTSDLYKNGREKIIIGSASGYKPEVLIYDISGNLLKKFLVYNKSFTAGVNVASCDPDGDYNNEIIVSPKTGGGPHIRTFNKDGELKGQFFAGKASFKGGLNISCGDLDRDKKDEIILSPMKDGEPIISIYDARGEMIMNFLAYASGLRKEIKTQIADINSDYTKEIIAYTGTGARSHVRIFNVSGDLIKQFFAYGDNELRGINLTTYTKNEL